MKKPVITRMTTSKLQSVAQGAADAIRRYCKMLNEEIERNAIDVPGEQRRPFGPPKTLPETVTYKTSEIELLVSNLSDFAVRLDWFSVPTEKRTKLPKPHF